MKNQERKPIIAETVELSYTKGFYQFFCKTTAAVYAVIMAILKTAGSVVLCSARFGEPFPVRSRELWETLRPVHRVPVGDPYDWTDKTRVKWLYPVLDVAPVPVPFHPPEGRRYGYTWMEYDN